MLSHQSVGANLRPTSVRGAGVITGSQIQTARSLLGWDRKHLARACKLRIETLARAESAEGEPPITVRSEEHTSELQSHVNLVCRLLLEKKKKDEKRRALDERIPHHDRLV